MEEKIVKAFAEEFYRHNKQMRKAATIERIIAIAWLSVIVAMVVQVFVALIS